MITIAQKVKLKWEDSQYGNELQKFHGLPPPIWYMSYFVS
jgi:hypothetical protein